jgi:hypothetical protein
MTRKASKGRPRVYGRPVRAIGRAIGGFSAQPVTPTPAVVDPDCGGGCAFCEVLGQWICHCGAINESNRLYCCWCGCIVGTSTSG